MDIVKKEILIKEFKKLNYELIHSTNTILVFKEFTENQDIYNVIKIDFDVRDIDKKFVLGTTRQYTSFTFEELKALNILN